MVQVYLAAAVMADRGRVADLENQLRTDLSPDGYNRDAGWDATSLMEEVLGTE